MRAGNVNHPLQPPAGSPGSESLHEPDVVLEPDGVSLGAAAPGVVSRIAGLGIASLRADPCKGFLPPAHWNRLNRMKEEVSVERGKIHGDRGEKPGDAVRLCNV